MVHRPGRGWDSLSGPESRSLTSFSLKSLVHDPRQECVFVIDDHSMSPAARLQDSADGMRWYLLAILAQPNLLASLLSRHGIREGDDQGPPQGQDFGDRPGEQGSSEGQGQDQTHDSSPGREVRLWATGGTRPLRSSSDRATMQRQPSGSTSRPGFGFGIQRPCHATWTACAVCKLRLSYTAAYGAHAMNRQAGPFPSDAKEVVESLGNEAAHNPLLKSQAICLEGAERSLMKRLEVIKAQKAKAFAKQGYTEENIKEEGASQPSDAEELKTTPGRKMRKNEITAEEQEYDTRTESSWPVASLRVRTPWSSASTSRWRSSRRPMRTWCTFWRM